MLLRYADLGLREHSINLMDVQQTETARDANLLQGTHTQNTEFLNAGETADTFVTIPADATKGTQYPLLDAGFHLNNGAAGGLGGMYTYLDVINGLDATNRGPAGTAADATPIFSNASSGVDNGQIPDIHVTASFTPQPPSTAPVAKVQWALDGVPGAAVPWDGADASPAGAPTASFDFTIPANLMDQALLGAEPDRIFGDHTIWLQAIDSAGMPGRRSAPRSPWLDAMRSSRRSPSTRRSPTAPPARPRDRLPRPRSPRCPTGDRGAINCRPQRQVDRGLPCEL